MYSKWKILAFVGLGVMLGLASLVGIVGDTTEVIQESEIKPLGVFFDNNLNIPSKESYSEKVSWYGEVVNVSISANNPLLQLEAFVKTMDGEIIWISKFAGELKDKFVVMPGQGYVITIMNQGDEPLASGNYSFENAHFEDKDGNFVITKHGQLSLILVAVVLGVSIFIIAQYKMHKIGEKWEL